MKGFLASIFLGMLVVGFLNGESIGLHAKAEEVVPEAGTSIRLSGGVKTWSDVPSDRYIPRTCGILPGAWAEIVEPRYVVRGGMIWVHLNEVDPVLARPLCSGWVSFDLVFPDGAP